MRTTLSSFAPAFALTLAVALMTLCGIAGAAPQAPAAQGLTVVRDAETGELRAPTATELRALRASPVTTTREAPAQPQAVTGTRGESSAVLGERGLVYAVVKRGADGKLDHHCVDGAHTAARILDQSAPAAQGASRHDHR